ncbi:MAG: L-erythro-3,5-diaminohexanoate dehydrogenase [Actinomycetota bacterium]|nr:L-erythro-3,5-diaminohexanoate dehydrogenase [Actinomycetota bacterium]
MSFATWALDASALGTWRAVDPPGALPHIARILDAASPASDCEAEIDVEMLAVDATSYRAIRERCDANPQEMARVISQIVAKHGKLQNPWTGSGGVLMGRVRAVGARYEMSDLAVGERVVPLASLIAIPLSLESVGPADPASAQVPARGRAIVTGRMLCTSLPEDFSELVALAALDVYPAASHVREMAGAGQHVLVLGTGHAGLLAVAAAREAVGSTGHVTALDNSPRALARVGEIDSATATVQADVTDPVGVAAALARHGLPPADLTLLCTSVPGGEGSALLATAQRGTVLFFSTATRFAAAALGADAIGSQARLVIPNGLTDDRGEYAFELLRRIPALHRAFEVQP